MECSIRLEDAEEVVEPVVERVRIALEVEEEVARRRWRQRREPSLRREWLGLGRQEQLVAMLAGSPSLQLDPRLLPNPDQRVATDPLERWRDRERKIAEGLERRH